MGKSPGRWIKAVLFGKKHSKSRSSKNVTPDKRVSINTASQDYVAGSHDITTAHELIENGATYVRQETGIPDAPSATSVGGNQGQELCVVSVPLSDDEILRQNQSAAKAQAAFRGYLARRAFRALKGIIRLQALIRGHLVRRQAVATFFSMQAIVKLQAAVREWNSSVSNASEKRLQKCISGDLQVVRYDKIAANSYILKLLRSVPNPIPMSLQYNEAEPNSVSVWLERWSHSRVWIPVHPGKASHVKSHRKLAVENGTIKSKRTSRRAENAQNGDNGVSSSHETDAKRNLKKGTIQEDLVQKQPQHEPEKVRRSLRKVPVSVATAPEKVEAITGELEPQPTVKTVSEPEEAAVNAQETVNPVTPENGFDAPPSDEVFETTQNGLPPVDAENGTELKHEEMEEVSAKVDPKPTDRRSPAAKPELNESPSPTTPPNLPSYMAATQSAKAKLRASGSPKVAGVSHIRRHSLPTPSKSTSLSPAVQPPSNKGTPKTNRPAISNRDGWKR